MKMLAFGQQTLAEDQKEQTRESATKRKKERTNPSRERPLPIELLRARIGDRLKLTAGIKGILPALRTGPCHLFRCSLEPPANARSKQVTELWCLITAVFVPHTAPIKHQSRPTGELLPDLGEN